MQKEHERLLREGWQLGSDGCYRKFAINEARTSSLALTSPQRN